MGAVAINVFVEQGVRSSGAGHFAAIIVAATLVIFSVYTSFLVCGVDPAILVGLGVISLGTTWAMGDIAPRLEAIFVRSAGQRRPRES